MRYIDAEALKDALTEKVFTNYTDEFWGTMQVIDEMPTVYDPEKVIEEIQQVPFRTAGLHMRVINIIRNGGVKDE